MIDNDDPLLPFGCLEPRSLLILAPVMLFVVFFCGLGSILGLWGD